MVPGAGVEPAQTFGPRDFKSLASTCFATRAYVYTKRLGSESNRRTRLCRPLHNHSATQPKQNRPLKSGAGNETRTRDPNLGKVMLYQLSYSRFLCEGLILMVRLWVSSKGCLSSLDDTSTVTNIRSCIIFSE